MGDAMSARAILVALVGLCAARASAQPSHAALDGESMSWIDPAGIVAGAGGARGLNQVCACHGRLVIVAHGQQHFHRARR